MRREKIITMLLAFAMLLQSSCMFNKGTVNIAPSKKVQAPLSVSKVEIINHQLIITGTNLSNIKNLKIEGTSLNETFSIESKSATRVVANSIKAISIGVGGLFNLIVSDASAASTFQIDFSLCNATLNGRGFDCTITANNNDVLTYSDGKWIPKAPSLNGLVYQGSYDANLGIPPSPVDLAAGHYWIISNGGIIAGVAGSFNVGDWLIYNGTTWDKIVTPTAVTSFNSRHGDVLPIKGDYNLAKMGDVDFTTLPNSGEVLKFNGTSWVPGTTASGSIGTTELADGSVTNAKIADVAATKITGTLSAVQIGPLSISNSHVAASAAIDYSKLNVPDGAIPYAKLSVADGEIPQAKISGLSTALSVLIEDTVTNGVTTKAPTENAVFDFVTAGLGTKLNLSGGTMNMGAAITGLSALPMAGSEAASKDYVDTQTANSTSTATSGLATKEPIITNPNDITKYYRGDKTFQALDTLSVAENTNLYFTNARAVTALGPTLSTYATTSALTTGLATKEPTIATGTTSQYIKGDKSLGTLDTTAVVENGNLYFTDVRAQAALATTVSGLATTSSVTTGLAGKLDLTGGTLSGALIVDTTLALKDSTTNYVTIKANATTTPYNFILPTSAGSTGQVLKTDGSGNLSWYSLPAGGPANTDGLVEGTTNLYYTDVRAQAALAATVATLATTSSVTTGLATKEPTITAGTASQYWKGDKSWSNFATDAVSALTSTLANYATTANLATTNSNLSTLSTTVSGHSTSLATDATNISGLQTDVGTLTSGLSATNSTAATLATTVGTKLPLAGGTLSGNLSIDANLKLRDSTTNYVTISANSTTTPYNLILPAAVGTNGQVLKTDASGNLSWYTLPAGGPANTDGLLEGTTNLYYTDVRAQAALAATVATLATTSSVTTGLATKEPTITAGTASQYWKGDKTWSNFATDAVTALTSTLANYATTANLATTNSNLSTLSTTVAGHSTSLTTDATNISGLQTDVGTLTSGLAATNSTAATLATTVGTKLPLAGGTLSGNLSIDANLKLRDSTTNYVTISANSTTTPYNLILPAAVGTNGQVLKTDASGNLSWYTLPAGGPANTDGLVEGTTNLYYTDVRAQAALAATVATLATTSSVTTGLATKEPTITAGTASQYWKGDKSWSNFATDAVTALTSTLANYATTANLATTNSNLSTLSTTVAGHSTSLTTDATNISGLQTDVGTLSSGLAATNSTAATLATTVGTKLPLAGGTLTGDLKTETNIQFKDSTTNYVTLKANTTTAPYTLTLPAAVGSAGQVLKTDASGNLSWYTIPGTDLTSYTTTADLTTLLATAASTTASNLTTGLATKEPTITAGTASQYWKGDKTWSNFATDAVTALTSTLANYATTANLATTNSNLSTLSTTVSGHSTSLANDATNISGLQTDVGTLTSGLAATNSTAVTLATTVGTKLPLAGGTLTGDLKTETNIQFKDSTTNYVTLKANTATTPYTLTLPAAVGSAGQVLKTDASGNLSWYTIPGTDLTSYTTTADLTTLLATAASTTASNLTTGLATKEPTITAGTASQYWKGDKSWSNFATDAVTALTSTLANYATTANLATTNTNVTNLTTTVSGHSTSLAADASNIAVLQTDVGTLTSGLSATNLTAATLATTVGTKLPLAGGTLTGDLKAETNIQFKDGTTNYVTLKANTTTAPYTLTLPAAVGSAGQVLKTDASGNLSWYTIPATDLTSYTTTAELTTLLANKEPTITAGTASQYWKGDKTWSNFATDAVTALTSTLANYATTANLATTNTNVTNLTTTVSGHSTSLATDATNISGLQTDVAGINTHLTSLDTSVSTLTTNLSTTNTTASTLATTVAGKLPLAGGTMTGAIRFQATGGGTNYVGIAAPAAVATSFDFVLPNTKGTSGYVLKTDGNGVLSWVDQASVAPGTGVVTSASILDGTIVDADISSSAAITLTKLANLGTIILTNNNAIALGDGIQTAFDKTQSQLNNKQTNALADGKILVGNASGAAAAVTMSGDATIINSGVLSLKSTGTAGTYTSVTTDSQGRVTSGSNPAVVASLGVTSPLTNTGTTSAPIIAIPVATTSVNGYLGFTDWNTFNGKQDALSAGATINGIGYPINSSATLTVPLAAQNATDVVNKTYADGKIGGITFTQTALASGQYIKYDGTNWINSALSTSEITSGTLGVARGGTGAATLAANQILLGNGTSALASLAQGTTGQVLLSAGTSAPTWSTLLLSGGNIAQPAAAASALTISTTNAQNILLSPNSTGNVTVASASGGVYAPAYYYNSDRRLKENIQGIKGLESILGLRGVSFQWIHNGESEIGLIAQEVEQVLPQLVKTNPENGIKSVKYGNLVAPLIESIKELYRMIVGTQKTTQNIERNIASQNIQVKNLETEVQKLKRENAQLKADVEEIKRALRKK